MSLYQHANTGEIRDIDSALMAAWVAAGNPKSSAWVPYTPPPPPPPGPGPVPQSVTKRQLYRGLMQVGWLGTTMQQINASVDAILAAMPEPPRELARTEFYTSGAFLRNNPLLVGAMMSPPLSKSVAEVDDFFRLCGSFAPEGDG